MKSRSLYRVHTIAYATLAATLLIPPSGWTDTTKASELVSEAQAGDIEEIEEQMMDIAEDIEDSKDPLNEARQFLESLLAEVNQKTGSHYTLEEICEQVRQNIDLFEIPQDQQEAFLKTIDLLLAKDPAVIRDLQSQIDKLLDKTIEHGTGKHHHRHHKHGRWKKILVIIAATGTAIVVSAVSPQSAPAAIDTALTIIKSI